MSDEEGRKGELESVLIPERFLPVPGGLPVLDELPGDVEAELETTATKEERSAVARGRVVAQWLQQMERQCAPFSLEGLVVAAMHQGHRQARAAESLSGLTRLKAPSQLDILVAGEVFRADPSSLERAPLELDDLVEERVKEPEAGLVKGMAKRLLPVEAPQELEARVELQLESGIQGESVSGPIRSRHWLRVATVGVALAASVLMISRLGQLVPGVSPTTGSPTTGSPSIEATFEVASGDVLTTASGLSFTVTYVDSDSMSASDRDVLKAIGLPTLGGS